MVDAYAANRRLERSLRAASRKFEVGLEHGRKQPMYQEDVKPRGTLVATIVYNHDTQTVETVRHVGDLEKKSDK